MDMRMRRKGRDAATILNAIGAAGADPDSFARAGVTELPRLAASDITTLSVCDLDSGRRRVIGGPGSQLSAKDIAAFDRHFFAHPLVRFHSSHHAGGTHRISDALSPNAFRATDLYNEYYRNIGIDHALAIPLYVDDATLVSFVLNRAGRDFTDGEVQRLEQVRGWLAAMYRNARALSRAAEAIAQLREIAEGEDWAVVRLDGRRRVRELAPRAGAMLAETCGGMRLHTGAPMPAKIDGWLTRLAAGRTPRLAFAPLVLEGPHGQVTIRAMPEVAGTAAWLLLVRRGARTDATGAGSPALTGREREILDWVAAGKSDRQVAAIVGVSPRTVQKHLEHIFVKLGVENRTAAAMRVVRPRLSGEDRST